ncbi:MAG: prepilin-type N-terminal cleavage/methylation domain-containing protein [Myxococcaceae bacterium]|nr:prepilin-type N-terminal cleavage/methylation domain-containing protein [Myxococcaceae bacterium]MBH2006484.1 prepilin-type N-terminal cleavage/methylation domain-containing protein [Myxococcaceae bacterium]
MKNLSRSKVSGFSLLEVMIAMAIMGMALLYLFDAQARSMKLAAKGRSLNIATQLARKQLIDCKYDLLKKGFAIGDYENSGTFEGEGYRDFRWECHGLRFNMPPPSPEAINKAMKAQVNPESNQGNPMAGLDLNANMLAPFFGLISNTLGDSIRELVLIVRWQEQGVAEDLKIVTHVVDPKPLADLASLLSTQLNSPEMRRP